MIYGLMERDLWLDLEWHLTVSYTRYAVQICQLDLLSGNFQGFFDKNDFSPGCHSDQTGVIPEAENKRPLVIASRDHITNKHLK